jgi:hypothetical protein
MRSALSESSITPEAEFGFNEDGGLVGAHLRTELSTLADRGGGYHVPIVQ